MNVKTLVLIGMFAGIVGVSGLVCAQSKVALHVADGKFQLLRNGKPYQIKGVGGKTHLEQLAAAGGNSIRTWSTEGLGPILDAAHRHQLTVCAGIWLGHERHGFDYTDEVSVVKQLDATLRAVRKYKDHPALLAWGVGNEMEGEGTNPAVWYAVDHIAREIKRVDPNHPTVTVIAELGANEHKLRSLERFCPNIDIVGVNAYGGISSMAERYRKSGCTKPYIVTEHGPHGPWEVGKTRWGSSLEATSTAKGKAYAAGYESAVTKQPGLSLGSYAFVWGTKQETTATWFGMLLPDGSRLAAVDAMSEAWTGSPLANRCPEIQSLKVDKSDNLKPGEVISATLVATDPESGTTRIKWVLRFDSGIIGVGGDAQSAEAEFADAINSKGMAATVTIPEGGGSYRLFAYVYDDHGGAAVANAPLYVDAPIKPVASPPAKLPFAIYDDRSMGQPYAPSGYMGNTKAISMEFDCEENPHQGETCLKIHYSASDNWGGVIWQSPANDWDGQKPGGLNLTGANQLEFWARGATGGETVSFALGIVDGDHPYRDTAKAELKNVRLTKAWQKLRIPLDARDLSRIKSGFSWTLAGQGSPVTFYLDDIRYVSE